MVDELKSPFVFSQNELLQRFQSGVQYFAELAPHLYFLETSFYSAVEWLEYFNHSEVSKKSLHEVFDEYFVSFKVKMQFPDQGFVDSEFSNQNLFVFDPVIGVKFAQCFKLSFHSFIIAISSLLNDWKAHVMESDGFFLNLIL